MVAPVLANFAMAVARKGAIAVSPTLTDLEKVGIREGRLRGVARSENNGRQMLLQSMTLLLAVLEPTRRGEAK